jgi:hypothetical protein
MAKQFVYVWCLGRPFLRWKLTADFTPHVPPGVFRANQLDYRLLLVVGTKLLILIYDVLLWLGRGFAIGEGFGLC